MALTNSLIKRLETDLMRDVGSTTTLFSYVPVSGGSINDAYCLETNHGKFMLKVNNAKVYPGMFAAEAKGLKTIASTNTIAVPTVILNGEFEDDSYLILEWIEAKRATLKASEALGRRLAEMHRNTAPAFGLDEGNYMGSLPQSNRKHATWKAFFVEERLQPMVKLAVEKRLLNHSEIQLFELLYLKLDDLFYEEQPALIHGDLWGGNYLARTDDKPYLIDPAISYGNREFDIAMTTLFGGFTNEFYSAYDEAFPLQKGWEERLDLWNLYPLLLHLNLFGRSYLGQVRAALNSYL
ncbi:fructosamine kinase family protein [Mucilaginibacter sp. RS28]|uniref:Fructosamine kinase family protein n=1 Tax=Mucilaginibacter straminoryzae TaxID=2932774 RepID=A0A9X1X4W3_9SPHI|nr:fructosamine kinase family protein [Mucilaginibacter straminoryzae]MCJ8211222.1 fructosamine kinase family protein [Mucilaginibacter straminoryzae]